jgi:hypothetical protein
MAWLDIPTAFPPELKAMKYSARACDVMVTKDLCRTPNHHGSQKTLNYLFVYFSLHN